MPDISNISFFSNSNKDKLFSDFPHIVEFAIFNVRDSSRIFKEHKNPGIEICYVVKGEFNWRIDGRVVTLKPTDASLTCPWQTHAGSFGSLNRGKIAYITVDPELFKQDGTLHFGHWCSLSRQEEAQIGKILVEKDSAFIPNSKSLEQLFLNLYHELIARSIGYTTRINSIVTNFFIETARRIRSPLEYFIDLPEGIRFTLEDIQDNISHKWTLQEMSESAGMKSSAFSTWVKKATGFSPAQYLIYLRIQEAKNILRTTRESITEIAFDLGFSSSQHFAYSFKVFTGFTPKEYRENSGS